MNVTQLIEYHSLLTLCRTVRSGHPDYFQQKIHTESNTGRIHRSLTSGKLKNGDRTGLKLVSSSWRWRSIEQWNRMPENLRTENQISRFKRKLKIWIKESKPY